MLYLRYLHNNSYRLIEPDSSHMIGAKSRTNELAYTEWLGTIERSLAQLFDKQFVPIQLIVNAYAFGESRIGLNWNEVADGYFLQGCYVPQLNGAYGVLEKGRPRIIMPRHNMSGAYSGKY